jgi:hypothetical protein
MAMTSLSDSALVTRLVHGHKHGMSMESMVAGSVSDRSITEARGQVLLRKARQWLADEQPADAVPAL